MIRVVTTLELDDDARSTLAAAIAPHATLQVLADGEHPRDAEAEVLLVHEPPLGRDGLPRLRFLQLDTAGVDHLDRALWEGITVATASGLFTAPIAEYVIGAILLASQRVAERFANERERSWDDRWRLSGRPLAGSTMVLVGYGSIGREIARLASALRIRIVAVKARPELLEATGFDEAGVGDPHGALPALVVGIDRLAEVVADADWVVVSLPLTERTRMLVDRRALQAMHGDAWLINVGRGAVVDEEALLETLQAGAIGGAVLDVFSEEPLPPEHPLWTAPNTVITPHVSGGPSRIAVLAELLGENVRRYAAGEPPLNELDPARGY